MHDRLQRRVQVTGPFAREVHCSERVLEARVLSRGENPPRTLQLMDAAKALEPDGVDKVLLRRLARDSTRAAPGDAKVAVDGVG